MINGVTVVYTWDRTKNMLNEGSARKYKHPARFLLNYVIN